MRTAMLALLLSVNAAAADFVPPEVGAPHEAPEPGASQREQPLGVMLEVTVPPGADANAWIAREFAPRLKAEFGFALDVNYPAVPMAKGTVIVRGTVPRANLAALQKQVTVWADSPIGPYDSSGFGTFGPPR